MLHHRHLTPAKAALLAAVAIALCPASASAQIRRWDNNEVIPGTEDIDLSDSNLVLDGLDLSFADLRDQSFRDASIRGTVLTNAVLTDSDFKRAVFDDAVITGASFAEALFDSFTKEQLYSTASYRLRNLNGINLSENTLAGWDFSG